MTRVGEPNHNFMSMSANAIRDMRQHGMNDMIIACVLSEIRAAAIFEEKQRVSNLIAANPPIHIPAGDYLESLGEMAKP